MGAAGELGPAGFPTYARVRFIPDPTHQGQQESEADPDASPSEIEQWRALLQLLATETCDPSDCYFGLWEGWSSNRLTAGPPSVFPAALESRPAPTFCFAGRSQGRDLGSAGRGRDLGPAGVLSGWHAGADDDDDDDDDVRVAVRPCVVRCRRHRPALGQGRRPGRRSNGSSLIHASTQSLPTPTQNSPPTDSGRLPGSRPATARSCDYLTGSAYASMQHAGPENDLRQRWRVGRVEFSRA